MRSLRYFLTIGLVMPAAALAQSLNIDFNRTSGSGSGVPSVTFGAAAGQIGTWNSITTASSGTYNLVGLNNAASGVTATMSGNGAMESDSEAGASTDYGRLMWDYGRGFTQNGEVECTLNGLDRGVYRVYVYAYLPGAGGWYTDTFGAQVYHTNWVGLTINNLPSGSEVISGPATAGQFTDHKTHAVFEIAVPAGSPEVKVRVGCDLAYGLARCALNGIQLVKYDTTRLYVDQNAVGLATGLSWTNALPSLQDALAIADLADGAISEIWVADGTYYPTTTNSRSASFQMMNGVKIIGGLAGGESDVDDRDPWTNRAYLAGSIGASGPQDNSYNVVKAALVNQTAVLDGFWITSGYANGVGDQSAGGGLFVLDGDPVIRNCYFSGNYAKTGAAVAIEAGDPTLVNCTFINSVSDFEGGAVRYNATISSTLRMINCTFLNNDTNGQGGALYANWANVQLTNCVFNGGSAQWGGGAVYLSSINTAFITNCTFHANQGTIGAGGVHVAGGGDVAIVNSILWGNLSNQSSLLEKQLQGAPGTFIFGNSCIQNGEPNPVPGNGNINTNPQFVAPFGTNGIPGGLDDNLRLKAASPCIDRGNWASLPADYADLDGDGVTLNEKLPLDLDLNARRVDYLGVANLPGDVNPVDMGAYEFQASLLGDMNCDGVVNFADIDPFVEALSGEAAYGASYPSCYWLNADANQDGAVGFGDIDAFVELIGG